ncbi:MAG TPA: efflux RND transporter periplasmic adaptor subunit [Thermoanaerobaculia bacterium]|jgi:membrane fusion protein (multidrug efflux system)|nr:efflux RND transporter periplasmic adaptor subunit [Thermoanaerobaculia bacterium]
MKRLPLLVLLPLAILGCAKKETVATTTSAPPALPADVRKVSAATTAAPEGTDPSASAGVGMTPTATASGDSIVATGEFVSPVRSELAAKLPGRVAKVYVDEGARVSRGQALLELETDYPRLNLQRAEADAARAKAAQEDARRDLERKKDLIAKDSIPRATYDRSQAMYDQAAAAVASAQAQSALFRQQINDSVVRSPIDGVVAEKRTDVGQRLGDNTVAFVVVQTSPVKLRFRVPERSLATVKKGQNVKATVDPYPGETFEGKVTMVGGVIDSATRSFIVETEFPNRDGRLKPGLFARVEMAAR